MEGSNNSKRSHKKCLSMIGLNGGKKESGFGAYAGSFLSKFSTQQTTTSSVSTPKDTTQDSISHIRTLSEIYSPSVLSLSSFIPSTSKARCTDHFCANQAKTSKSKVAALESVVINLNAELEAMRNTNEELRETLGKYERKIAMLLSRTTDCMGRVIGTKNNEISRLEQRLVRKSEQFAAKLEAETLKTRELEEHSLHSTVKSLETVVSRVTTENTELKAEVRTLSVKLQATERELEQCLSRQDSLLHREQSLASLTQQLSELERLQEALLRDNAALRNQSAEPHSETQVWTGVRELCEGIARLKHLVKSCKEGDMREVMRGFAGDLGDRAQWVKHAKADLKEVESQLIAWYSSQCGSECQIS